MSLGLSLALSCAILLAKYRFVNHFVKGNFRYACPQFRFKNAPIFPILPTLRRQEYAAENECCVRPPTGSWSGNQGDLYMHELPVNTIMGTETRLNGKK
jgi:hypothetical protein